MEIEQRVLRQLLKAALVWASHDETRPHLCQVRFVGEAGKVGMVSTNGHGLWRCESVPVVKAAGKVDFGITVACAKRLVSLLDGKKPPRRKCSYFAVTPPQAPPSTCVFSGGYAKFGDVRLRLALAPDGFPDWRKVIPSTLTQSGPIGFSAANIARVAAALPGTTRQDSVKVTLGDALDPQRFDGLVGDIPAFVILMPVRL